MEPTPLERIRGAIEQVTGPGRQTTDGQWQLRCPAHSDRNPSLSLGENPQHHALLCCQAGCDTDAILTAVGLARRDLYPIRQGEPSADPVVATYRYTDEQGQLLYEVQRTAAKRFRQRRPDPDQPGRYLYNLQDTRRVLYRLPLLAEAIRNSQTIYLAEGEKDVHTIEQYGQIGTTNPGGVGKWRPEYTQTLAGAHVVIIADIDTHGKGMQHARHLYQQLRPVAASVAITRSAVGKDVTDHHTAGLGLDDLLIVSPETPIPPPAALGDGTEAAVDPSLAPISPAPDPEPIRLRMTPASAFRMRPVQWVWQDRMPLGEICLIPGREGIGKSTFLAWLAARITRGTLPGIYEGQPRAVMYAASEDAWDYTIAPRMFAAGADLELIYRVDVVSEEISTKLTLPIHARLIPQVAEEYKVAMLMCDPLLSNLDDRINPNYSRELRVALEPLRDAAEQAGIAVAGLAHFNKTKDVDVASMISGSRGWMEVARAAIAVARDKRSDDNGESHVQVVSQIKNNLGSLDLPSLEYRLVNHEFTLDDGTEIRVGRVEWTEGVSLTTAEEVLRRAIPRGNTEGDDPRNLAEQIIEVLREADIAMSPKDVTDRLDGGGSRESVKRTLLRLAGGDKVERVGTGLYKAINESARARTRESPPLSPPRSLPKSNNMREGDTGSYKGVSPREEGTGTKAGDNSQVGHARTRARDDTPRALVSCRKCFGPLEDVDGTGVHPSCADEV